MTAAPEDLRQTMNQRVALLRMLRHCLFVHSGKLGDLAGELLIEKLPPFASRQLGGHQTAACAVLALHRDDLEHWPPPSLDWVRDRPFNCAASMIARFLLTRSASCGPRCAAYQVLRIVKLVKVLSPARS